LRPLQKVLNEREETDVDHLPDLPPRDEAAERPSATWALPRKAAGE